MEMLYLFFIVSLIIMIASSSVEAFDVVKMFKLKKGNYNSYKGLRHSRPSNNQPLVFPAEQEVYEKERASSQKLVATSMQGTTNPWQSPVESSSLSSTIPAAMSEGNAICTCTCSCDIPICTSSPTQLPTQVFLSF